MIGCKGNSPTIIWKRTSQGYSTMEALRRDTFEDASSWAVDEQWIGSDQWVNLTCLELNRSHKWPTNVDSFWWTWWILEMITSFWVEFVNLHLCISFWVHPNLFQIRREGVPRHLHSYHISYHQPFNRIPPDFGCCRSTSLTKAYSKACYVCFLWIQL